MLWIFDESGHEFVVPLDIGLRISQLHLLEVLLRHDFEEETENAGTKLRIVMFSFAVQEMDDVHLKIEELTVDGMFTWGMEMELRAMEGCNWDMWVEE